MRWRRVLTNHSEFTTRLVLPPDPLDDSLVETTEGMVAVEGKRRATPLRVASAKAKGGLRHFDASGVRRYHQASSHRRPEVQPSTHFARDGRGRGGDISLWAEASTEASSGARRDDGRAWTRRGIHAEDRHQCGGDREQGARGA